MRSALSDIILIVEGDSDVGLLSNSLGLSNGNFLSCDGKLKLDELYKLGPAEGLDRGMIFFRDRDFDGLSTSLEDGVLRVITSNYDIEMDLINGRIFRRIFNGFGKLNDDDTSYIAAWETLCSSCAKLGALRSISLTNALALDFDNLKLNKFVSTTDLSVDTERMVTYVANKSKSHVEGEAIAKRIEELQSEKASASLCCIYDLLEFLRLLLSRVYDFGSSSKCAPEITSIMLRAMVTVEDIARTDWYEPLRDHIISCGYAWSGRALP